MTRTEEFDEKKGRVRSFLENNRLDAVLLSLQCNVSWLTCGSETHIAIASTESSVSVLATRENCYIIANNIEAPRFEREEIGKLGIAIKSFPWQSPGELIRLARETGGEKISSDDGKIGKNIGEEFGSLRYSLTEAEVTRYRELGKNAGTIIEEVARKIRPGDKECEVSGRLAKTLLDINITPVVLLIAADERIEEYRHPIPTEKTVEKYMMLVLCARKKGLIVSLTRMVHFGRLPETLEKKHNAVVEVDATLIAESRPGTRFSDIFRKAADRYKEKGFPGEWQHHHQGGPTGYQCRDFKATLEEKRTVLPYQALAWNPSIRGTKSEDTVIALPEQTEIITTSQEWPKLKLNYNNKIWERPDILVL